MKLTLCHSYISQPRRNASVP